MKKSNYNWKCKYRYSKKNLVEIVGQYTYRYWYCTGMYRYTTHALGHDDDTTHHSLVIG